MFGKWLSKLFGKGDVREPIKKAAKSAYNRPSPLDSVPDTEGNRAAKLYLRGLWDEAKVIWEELLLSHPDDMDVKENFAIALLKEGKKNPERMEEYFKKAVALCPQNSGTHVSAAKGYYNAGHYAKAAEHFILGNKYLEDPEEEPTIESKRAMGKEWVGSCYDKLGDYRNAVKYWEECLKERHCWDPRSKAGIEEDLARVKRLL